MRLVDADALDTVIIQLNENGWGITRGEYKLIDSVLFEMPTIEPQRKKGKWIEHNPHKWGLGIVFECSECGEKIDCEPSNFCPNCGADMREPEDIPMEYFENGGR